MSLSASFPPAFLALWNDIDASRDADYERWHSLEHVPERVWTPGFIAGTRYVATRADQARYFTLYDLETLAALTSAAYQDLVDHPTPWSASMRPAFANFLRKPCGETVASAASPAPASQPALLVMRVVFSNALPATTMTRWTEAILVDSAPFGAASVRGGRIETAGPQAMKNRDDAPAGEEWVLLVHAIDPDRLAEIEQVVIAAMTASTDRFITQLNAPASTGTTASTVAQTASSVPTQTAAHLPIPRWHTCAHYRLLGRVDHADVAQPSRPAPRLDLMPRTSIG